MATTVDEQGRIYLPEDVRDRYGDQYRIVKLPNHAVLLPINDDPIEGIHEAVGDAFDDIDHDDLTEVTIAGTKTEVRSKIDCIPIEKRDS